MTAKFVAQKQAKTEKHLIVFQIYHKRKIWNYGTGISVFENEWNPKEQKVKKKDKYDRQYVSLNGTLASYQNVFNNVYASFGGTFAKAKMVTTEAFKEAIDKEMILAGLRNPTELQAPKNEKLFFDYCKDYLRTDNNGKKKAYSTIEQYKSTFSILAEYKPEIILDEVNKSYLFELQEFLYGKGYDLNGVANAITRIKAVLNWLANQNILTNLDYRSFKIKKQETTQIALTVAEIDAIRNAPLTGNLMLARDLFLFQSLVGVRYSDMQILQKEHFIVKNGINYLCFHNVKTSKKIEVPLFDDEAWEIAKKYDFNFKDIAYRLDTQDILLKEIGKMAGLADKVEVISYPKGVKKIEFMLKYELIGTHTARRSFVTLASNAGLTAPQIGQFTGQSTQTVNRYIKTSDETKEVDMLTILKKRKNQ